MVIARILPGKYRKRKNWITLALFLNMLILPFIQVKGHPIIQLDIPNRIFYVFGLTIWPQELYFLHLILMAAGISLFFFTALYGRVWCAYGCPQTIMTEVYDWVGRRVAGNKYGKKSISSTSKALVYFAWFLTSAFLSLLFISYFKGVYNIADELSKGEFLTPAGSIKTWILFWGAFTAAALFIWGYFRENACKYVCPYGRFQTAMLDGHSPIVAYDEKRGEPRRQKGEKPGQSQGDCTACNLCQVVCPTGIDIREGLQVGCIRCGLCVDACTIEMSKFGKPTLIDMVTIDQVEDKQAPRHYFRVRTAIYGTLLTIFLGVFIYLLATRIPFTLNVIRSRYVPPTYIEGEGFQNLYEADIANMSFEKKQFKIRLISTDPHLVLPQGEQIVEVAPEELKKVNLIVRYKVTDKKANKSLIPFRIEAIDMSNSDYKKEKETVFSFPLED